MRRKILFIGLGMFLLPMAVSARIIQAAEEAKTEAVEEADQTGVEWEYSYGSVVSVAPDKIVVKEYDYDKDVEVEVTYLIESDIELQNVTSIDQIKAGDDIDLYFDSKDDKKIARIISVESPEEKQETEQKAPAAEQPSEDASKAQ